MNAMVAVRIAFAGGRESRARLALMVVGVAVGVVLLLISLTVSVIAGLMERRRPFALLRASGVRLGELREIALLESGVPLVLTVLGGIGVAMLAAYVSVPAGAWVPPDPGFFLRLGAGVAFALCVCLITWPLMDTATRHDSVRFE